MRILILNHNIRERGTYFRARKIAEGFAARGHRITFFCSGHGWYRARQKEATRQWTEWETASWTPQGIGEGATPLGLLQRCYLIRGNFDLVYTFSHFPVDQLTARFLRNRCGFWMTDWCDLWNSTWGGFHDTRNWPRPLPPLVKGLRGKVILNLFKADDFLESWAPKSADATSVIASPMRNYTQQLDIHDDRVLHLVSGADTASIQVMDKDQCRKKLGLTNDRPIVAYIANTTPDNKQMEGALRILWKERPDALVLSVGPRWFDEDSWLATQVEKGSMIDYGRQPFAEISTFMGAADLLTMPMRDLPFNQCRWPNKFGDYMAAGRPTATTNVGDMGRVIRRYQVGVAGEASEQGLAESMITLIEKKDFATDCGYRARELAESQFSWARKHHRLRRFLRGRGLTGC